MDIARDYLAAVRFPIVSIIVLFIIQAVIVAAINIFTDLKVDTEINALVLGWIIFAFILLNWQIYVWAGIRTARASSGSMIDGAIGGAITAVVAGLVTGILTIIFKISTINALIGTAPEPTGAAATWIMGFLSVTVDIFVIVLLIFVNLIAGALFGGLGGIIHNRKLIEQMNKY